MNWSDFFVKVFGSSASKEELDLLNSWKQESNASLNSINKLTKPTELDRLDLSSYRQYDVDSAMEKSILQIKNYQRSKNLKYALGGALILLILALMFNFSQNSRQGGKIDVQGTYIASKDYYENIRSDGTQISFNSDTKLVFEEDINTYDLIGTAFFDVVKQNKPLKIRTPQGQVEVVGTSFNIDVQGEVTSVLMHEGVVSFTDLNGQSYSVSKGQLLIADKGQISVEENVKDQTFTYWRTKQLNYTNEPLMNIIADLSRLFDKSLPSITQEEGELSVTVVFEGGSYTDMISELETITGVLLSK